MGVQCDGVVLLLEGMLAETGGRIAHGRVVGLPKRIGGCKLGFDVDETGLGGAELIGEEGDFVVEVGDLVVCAVGGLWT